jgi:hypothetical protein
MLSECRCVVAFIGDHGGKIPIPFAIGDSSP